MTSTSIPPILSTYPAMKRLKAACPVPDEPNAALRIFCKLLVDHMASNSRALLFFVDRLATDTLEDYVNTEARVVHLKALGYEPEATEQTERLRVLSREYHILRALYAYVSVSGDIITPDGPQAAEMVTALAAALGVPKPKKGA